MFKIIVDEFSNLFLLIVLFFISIIFVSIIFNFITSNKKGLSERKVRLHGMFVGMNSRTIAMLSAITLRTFLIIFSVCIFNKNIVIYLFMILLTSVIYIILRLNLKVLCFESINIIMQLIAIYLVNILKEYIININNEYTVNIIKNFLIIFIIMYSIYSYLRNFEDLISRNTNKKYKLEI